ncbi:RNHCP domain-containing protein [Streptosporangium amethystogenes]|uniref:RNHCP domain-containing protein n=1 Tax=Streptosporangium amethystogenes TaxID=2002 RepID=UPI003791F3CA
MPINSDFQKIDTFDCTRCGLTATTYAADGGRRNHCPSCLHSLHIEDRSGGDVGDGDALVGGQPEYGRKTLRVVTDADVEAFV